MNGRTDIQARPESRRQWRDYCTVCRKEIETPSRAAVVSDRGDMMHLGCIPTNHPAYRFRVHELLGHPDIIEVENDYPRSAIEPGATQ
jgi:hypothetical protein